VDKGYYSDEFLGRFVPPVPHEFPDHISRSNWLRVELVRRVIDAFIREGGTQIVSLGAGFETTFFQLLSQVRLLYIELL